LLACLLWGHHIGAAKVQVFWDMTLCEGSTARPWSWRHRDPRKSQYIDTQLHGVTYQKTWVSPKRRVFGLDKNGSFLSGATRQKVLKRLFFIVLKAVIGACGGAVGWGTALQAVRSRVRFPMVSFEFFIDIILSAALWPRGWLSL
jgi:hypothetical protein